MYTAWEEATKRKEYDYYLWLNDDTFIYPDSISRLLNDSISVKDEAIICGATCSEKDGKPTYGVETITALSLQMEVYKYANILMAMSF